MEKHEHWTGRAACVQELRHAQRKMEVERLRQFLKERPTLQVSRNGFAEWKNKPLDVCWGSDKTYYMGSDKQKKGRC